MDIEAIVNTANANEALMDGTTGPVVDILEGADVVLAVFNDGAAENGVGIVVVKGRPLLDAIAAGGQAVPVKVNAIKTISRSMAIAARDVLGDGPNGESGTAI